VTNLVDSDIAGRDRLSGVYTAITAVFLLLGLVLFCSKSVLHVDAIEHTCWPLLRRNYSIAHLEEMKWVDKKKQSLLLLLQADGSSCGVVFASGRLHFLEQLKLRAPATLWPPQ
jgi:hypothetical protein